MSDCPRPYPIHRLCFVCGGPIQLCSAYSLGRDILAAWNGKIPFAWIREYCGRCDGRKGADAIVLGAGYYPGCGPSG